MGGGSRRSGPARFEGPGAWTCAASPALTRLGDTFSALPPFPSQLRFTVGERGWVLRLFSFSFGQLAQKALSFD